MQSISQQSFRQTDRQAVRQSLPFHCLLSSWRALRHSRSFCFNRLSTTGIVPVRGVDVGVVGGEEVEGVVDEWMISQRA